MSDEACVERECTNDAQTAQGFSAWAVEAYRLRSRTRRLASSRRERCCGLLPTVHATEHPSVRVRAVNGKRSAAWHGVGLCEHVWTCPVCASRLRAAKATRCVHAVQGVGGRWQMLTLTIRHHEGMALAKLLRGITAAWRRTRQGGRVQRLWTQHVRASIRATEITYGDGWHPHIHVLLATDEWDQNDRDTLWQRFRECVRAELGEECVPNYSHGMRWSHGFEASSTDAEWLARYVSKFACEVAGIEKEATWAQSRTPWEVAAAATRGDQKALRLWQEYELATRGRRAVELDDRAAAAADDWEERQREENDAKRKEGDEPPEGREIQVTRDELWVLRRFERRRATIMVDVLSAAVASGEQGVRDLVRLAEVTLWRDGTRSGYSQERDGKEEAPRCGFGGPRTQAREDFGARPYRPSGSEVAVLS